MSRTPSAASITVVRGSTWEDSFDYYEDDGITPINLTGYAARMHVRTLDGAYGTTTTTTLILALVSTGVSPLLTIVPISPSTIPNRIKILATPAQHVTLNPLNEKRKRYSFSLEAYIPAGVNPEYVLPIAQGKLVCLGEVTR